MVKVGNWDIPLGNILADAMLVLFVLALVILLIGGKIGRTYATPIAAMTQGNMSDAPSLAQRNYYADEVRVVNRCLPSHMDLFGITGGNMPDGGWGETFLKCENSSRLETSYGAVIQRGVQFFWNDSTGRITGVMNAGKEWQDVPSVASAHRDDVNYFAYGLASEITASMNGMQVIRQNGNCVSVIVPQLVNSTANAIRLQHYAYPYTRVIRTSDGWCFVTP